MPVLSGVIADVTNTPITADDLVELFVKVPAPRVSGSGTDQIITMTTVTVDVDPVNGSFSVNLDPGVAILVVRTFQSHDTFNLAVRENMTTIREAIIEEIGSLPELEASELVALAAQVRADHNRVRDWHDAVQDWYPVIEGWHGDVDGWQAQVAEDRQIALDASALAVLAASQAGRIFGEGDPEGEHDAPIGTLYVDTNTGVMWHKATQEGNPNGWTLLETGDGTVLAAAEHADRAANEADRAKDEVDRAESFSLAQDDAVRGLVSSPTLTQAALNRRYSQVVTPESFGAVGDGTVNDTAAIQSALNVSASTGRPVELSGRYRVNNTLNVASGTKVQGVPGAEIVVPSALGNLWSIQGELGTGVQLTANADTGTAQLQVSSGSGFSENDVLHLVSQRVAVSEDAGAEWRLGAPTNEDWTCYFGEFARVRSVSGTTVSLEHPILFPGYRPNNSGETAPLARSSATLHKVNPVKNVSIGGFKVSGRIATVFAVAYGVNVRIHDVDWTSELNGGLVTFQKCLDSEATRCRVVYTTPDSESGTRGAFKTMSAQNCGFTNCYVQRAYSGVDFTYTDQLATPNIACYVRDCTADSIMSVAFNCHGGAYKCSWIGNRALNCRGTGIQNRGLESVISSNVLVGGNTSTGVSIYQSGSRNAVVTGNTISGFEVGVRAWEGVTYDRRMQWIGLVLSNNSITGFYSQGVRIVRAAGAGADWMGFTGVSITGNVIRGGGTSAAKGIQIAPYVSGVQILHNNISMATGGNACVYTEGNTPHIHVEGNKFASASRGLWLANTTDSANLPNGPEIVVGGGNSVEAIGVRYQHDGVIRRFINIGSGGPALAGSISGGTALPNLIQLLASMGLFTNNTTA